MQIIYQDPFGSLNPRMRLLTSWASLPDPPGHLAGGEYADRVAALLEMVGLSPAMAGRNPTSSAAGSGSASDRKGAGARARFIVCDEPVSAWTYPSRPSHQPAEDLQDRLGLAYLFIAHDLSVVRHISSRVAVMYLGRIVEVAPRADLYRRPLHPYTKALLQAVPVPDPALERARDHSLITGEVPGLLAAPTGCAFHPRCPFAMEVCQRSRPELKETGGTGHMAACHLLHRDTNGG
jgi:oligopeptide transport system ATP-binding protein